MVPVTNNADIGTEKSVSAVSDEGSMALFKDILYPGNPGRRDKVVRKYQELLSCMKDNFYALNEVGKYTKQNITVQSAVGKIVHTYNNLELKEGTTIKENCDAFVKEAEKLKMAVSLVRDCELIFIQNLAILWNVLYLKIYRLKIEQ